MSKKEIKQMVKLCDYYDLQKLWKSKLGDEFYSKPLTAICIVQDEEWSGAGCGVFVWLPRIEDCIQLLAKYGKYSPKLEMYEAKILIGDTIAQNSRVDARIACLKALKRVLKGD